MDAEPVMPRRIRVLDEFVLSVVTHGRGLYRESSDGPTQPIEPGSLTLTMPRQPYWYRTRPGERWMEWLVAAEVGLSYDDFRRGVTEVFGLRPRTPITTPSARGVRSMPRLTAIQAARCPTGWATPTSSTSPTPSSASSVPPRARTDARPGASRRMVDAVPDSPAPAADRPHHFLVQAPVPVLDVDGFTVTILGLVAFAVASVLAAIFYPTLEQRGNGWWLGVCISGFGLGLIGLAYCLYRRSRRRAGRWDRD